MGHHWNIPRRHDAKEQIAQTGGRRMVRRLDQYVSAVGEGEKMAATQCRDKIGNHVIIGAGHQAQRNGSGVEFLLQLLNSEANIGTAVMVEARQDMRRAGKRRHALGDRGARHR